jgi:TrmH family RNA methyltransferase
VKRISSRDNPVWKSLSRLCLSGRERRKQGKCVLEGAHTIRAFIERFGNPELIIAEADAATTDREIVALLRHADPSRIVIADARLFGELAQTATPTGMLAVASTPQPSRTKPGRFNILLEDIQDPGNVGTILRIAAAAGASHVFLTSRCAFAWSPKVLRASQGAHFYVDIVENADLLRLAPAFDGKVVAAVPRASRSLFDADLTGPVMLLVGNEGAGLSEAALEVATLRVAIPMPGGFESLNAASATAVIAFEKLRQDQQRGRRTDASRRTLRDDSRT